MELTPINLKEIKDKDSVSGLLYIQSHTQKDMRSTSKAPVTGMAYYQGKTMKFKIWDVQYQTIFSNNSLEGAIIAVNADAGVYQDNIELTLSFINFAHGVETTHIFFKSADVETIFAEFGTFVNAELSQNAIKALTTLFQRENLYEPFKLTWAGAKMHDAQVGGLMNHTMKMLRIAKVLMENDHRLRQWQDLLYMGIILHDIGKPYEIVDGVYTEHSFVSHRALGVEIISRHKDIIVELLGETFFYHMVAIQLGHHGEYADRPTTIWAQIVHLIDMVESQVTGFLDSYENGNLTTRNGNKAIWNNGSYLTV